MNTVTGSIFRLARPFWLHAAGRHRSWLLGAALIALVVAVTALNLWLNALNKGFFDALQKLDAPAFNHNITLFFAAAAVVVAVMTLNSYLEQGLSIRWREQLTASMTERWLQGHTFYRIERDGLCDNPDQRLAQDISEYVRLMISLSLGFIANLGTLLTMGWILWQSAGPITFHPGGATLTIPGYLFWLAIFWGLLQTAMTHLSGHRLAGLTVEQQRVEADFRFALAKVRESAEQIALYGGQPAERSRLQNLFQDIRLNWRQLMRHNVFLNGTTTTFSVIAVLVPIVAVSPKVLSGDLSLGTLMQDVGAFSATTAAVAWFALSYRDLFQLSARVRRLAGLDAAMAPPPPPGIVLTREGSDTEIRGESVALSLPDGRLLSTLDAFCFSPGERWMVRGPSGAGKSTLLRAIAGLWPFGNGRIRLPAGARIMFMPQKNYLADGPLRDVLAYPADSAGLDDRALDQLLRDCRLPRLAGRLDESANWSHRLSPGEQQRLAFVRVLLYRPDILFMDEASSALDNDTEAHLYRLVIERLPGCTLISVAHRETLLAFHERQLQIAAPG